MWWKCYRTGGERMSKELTMKERFDKYCQSDRSKCINNNKFCKDCLWDWVEKKRKEEQGKVLDILNDSNLNSHEQFRAIEKVFGIKY